MSFRIMSFNVRGDSHRHDGANSWDRRASLNVATIRKYAPDLIGFQELKQGNLSVYTAELPDYQYILGNEASGGVEYVSIFWKPAVFDLLESGSFWISETPEVFSGSWETDCIRAATWARFQEKSSGRAFLHLNTHLDHISERARAEGCRLIVRRMSEVCSDNLPLLLTGDFNCNAYQPPQEDEADCADANYRALVNSGFVDTYLAAGNTDSAASNTFHAFQGAAFAPDRSGNAGRIDWILARDGASSVRVLAAGIIRDHQAPLYPSDHYPIYADLALG